MEGSDRGLIEETRNHSTTL